MRIVSCLLLIVLPSFVSLAQDKTDSTRPYVPARGFMGLTQSRHFKLWFAGRTENWVLDAYEIEQIRKSFDSAKLYYLKIGDVDAAAMITADSFAPLHALKAAAEAHDRAKFSVEFDKLTAACNACHQATHFGFINIEVPTARSATRSSFRFGKSRAIDTVRDCGGSMG
jgi:hypothetical protein